MLCSNGDCVLNEQGKPAIVEKYNVNMGGVDLNDQMCAYYRTGRASHKWWRYVLFYLLNISLTNAWVLWKNSIHEGALPRGYDHMKFRMEVMSSLRDGYTSRTQNTGRPRRIEVQPVSSVAGHALVRIQGRTRICRQCSRFGCLTPKGRKRETAYMCKTCSLPLCREGCLRDFHNAEQ